MNYYTVLASFYDLLDAMLFAQKGVNPRRVIEEAIPNNRLRVLDMCCGTFENGAVIARRDRSNLVFGIDRSRDMLREANKKVQANDLHNVRLICGDATNTHMEESSFDCIIIGLVLHECSPELCAKFLAEARRLLKPNGTLYVLEWEKEHSIGRRIAFAPLYVLEALYSKTFRRFYHSDKEKYFKKHGFHVVNKTYCNYSAVYELKL